MRLSRGWREAAVFVVLYEVYETARGHIHPAGGPSVAHAESLVHLERTLGVFQEGRLQGAFIGHPTVIQLWDIYYGTVHFLVPALGLWLLWRRCPERYHRARTVFLVMCFTGLVVFAVYPLAPPRYMPAHYGFVDTAARWGGLGPLDSGKTKDTNPFAAMPSLHIGWSVWCAWVLVPLVSSRPARLAAALYPVITLTAIVVTANHWILDAGGGVAVFAVALGLTSAGHRFARRDRSGADQVGAHDGRILGPRGAFDGPPRPVPAGPARVSSLQRHLSDTDHLRP